MAQRKKQQKGKLIVIDGLDGSGKATQTKLLVSRLKKEGYRTAVTDFPQYYSSFFGKMAGRYLKGEFGTAQQVSPYLASMLFALDRWEAKDKLQRWLAEGRVVISNRYVTANQIHQAGKIRGKREKQKFMKWLEDLEYHVLGIPKPNKVIFLHVPYRVGQRLVEKKGTRKYVGGAKKDIHESSRRHLTDAQQQVFDLVKHSAKWTRVDCMEGATLLSRQDIHERVWQVVKRLV